MTTPEYPDYSTLVWTENIGYKNKSFILLDESIIKKKVNTEWPKLDVWKNFSKEYSDIPSSWGLQIDIKISLVRYFLAKHRVLG